MVHLPLAPLVALAAATVFGTADFWGGLLARRHPSVVVVGWSHLSGLVLLSAICLVVGAPADHGWVWWSVLAGVGSGVGMAAFYAALASGTVGVVSSIAAAGLAVPVLFAIVQGERPGVLQMSGILLALAGIVLASGPELRHEEKVRARAVWLAVVAGVSFGLMDIGIVQGARSSNLFTMWGMRATTCVAWVTLALVKRTLGGVRPREVFGIAAQGMLDISGNALLAASTQLGMMSVGVVLSSLYPVVTIALAALVLHERLRGVQVWGVATALAGVVLMNAA